MTDYPGTTILLAGDAEFTLLVADALHAAKVAAHVVIPGRDPLSIATIGRLEPDLILLAGYMDVVLDWVLDSYTVLGFHPSLLPRFRGGSAVKWQRHLEPDVPAGCTIYRLVPGKLDAGPIVDQALAPHPAGWYATDGELYRELRRLGAALFANDVREHLTRGLTFTEQDERRATWHPRLAPGQSPTEYLAHVGADAPR